MVSYFRKLFKKLFKPKVIVKPVICPHTHENVDEFLLSFNDHELNALRSELIGCERVDIPEYITDILIYLKDKCTEEDYAWICQEIKKEYKNYK